MTIIPYFRKSVKIKSKPWADPQCYIPKDDGIPSCLSLCNKISVEWDVHSSPWQRHLRCQTHNWERVPHSPYFMKTSHQPPPPHPTYTTLFSPICQILSNHSLNFAIRTWSLIFYYLIKMNIHMEPSSL